MPPDRLRNLEYLPEPEDPRMLTAIDPEAPGYAPSAYGATFNESNAWRNATAETLRQSKPRPWGIMVALCVVSLLILAYPQMTLFFADALAPDSEWAYEDTNIYACKTNMVCLEMVYEYASSIQDLNQTILRLRMSIWWVIAILLEMKMLLFRIVEKTVMAQ